MVLKSGVTAVFIALFNDEEEHREGIAEIISELEGGKSSIICSVLVKTEILDCKYDKDDVWSKVVDFLKRPDIEFVPVTDDIAEKAREIRSFLLERRETKKLPCIDAIHLATAILKKADRLHSTDKDHMLNLQGKLEGNPIEISRPMGIQGIMF